MTEPALSMVFLSENPLLNLDTASVHLIDTQNTDNLHAFWSVCSRCARTDALQNAKRLENLSWRIYSQQSLARSLENRYKGIPIQGSASVETIPDLSRSAESPLSSDDEMGTPPDSDLSAGLRHMALLDSPKMISSVKLETIVKTVTENNVLEPLSPLPATIAFPLTTQTHVQQSEQSNPQTTTSDDQPEHADKLASVASLPNRKDVESSTSTMPTTAANSALFESSIHASTETAATDFSTSIVRGFSRDVISRSVRSKTNLLPPTPILKQSSPVPLFNPLARSGKKKTTFMIGASSEGDESSYESPKRSSLGQRLQEYEHSYDHNHSESAIDDDDDEDDGDWEDEDPSQQEELFQRVQSSNNIASRPSLLTNMLHEQDRMTALQNAASRSTPAIRRSRTSSYNGPSLGTSPQVDAPHLSHARPIMTAETATASMPVALSPRTNRRNMLQSELTGSLRKHLLWERQQRFPAAKALKNRGYRSEIQLSNHQQQQQTQQPQQPQQPQGESSTQEESSRRNDTTIYDNGLQEYFEKGW